MTTKISIDSFLGSLVDVDDVTRLRLVEEKITDLDFTCKIDINEFCENIVRKFDEPSNSIKICVLCGIPDKIYNPIINKVTDEITIDINGTKCNINKIESISFSEADNCFEIAFG